PRSPPFPYHDALPILAVNHINGLLWAFSGPRDDEGVGERTPRRDRLREQLSHDIKRSARRLLVEQGPFTLTLSAIARDVEVTARSEEHTSELQSREKL